MKLNEEGEVRAMGMSIHDRQRAGQLAEDSPLDALIRDNAAHPSAERDIFPHLATASVSPMRLWTWSSPAPPKLSRSTSTVPPWSAGPVS